jgi:hypothetical protein
MNRAGAQIELTASRVSGTVCTNIGGGPNESIDFDSRVLISHGN